LNKRNSKARKRKKLEPLFVHALTKEEIGMEPRQESKGLKREEGWTPKPDTPFYL